jgi:hypothetical protein
VFLLIAVLVKVDPAQIWQLLPGLIALPIYTLIPCLNGHGVPLSLPTEEAKSAGRGLTMIGGMIVAFALAGLSTFAWATGWFIWLLLLETIIITAIYVVMRKSIASARWQSAE